MPILQIQVLGPNQPGVLESLTARLAFQGIRVLDIGQALIQQSLSLGLLVEASPAATPRVQTLIEHGRRLQLNVQISELSDADYANWISQQSKPPQVVSLFGSQLCAEHIERVGTLATRHGLSITNVARLSSLKQLSNLNQLSSLNQLSPPQQQPQPDAISECFEFTLRGLPDDAAALRSDILDATHALNCDIAIQTDDVYRSNRRFIAFDMDSTLIQAEVIDELARAHGVVEQVSKITEAAMNGELDFNESLRRRLSLLRGLSTSVMQGIADRIALSDGAERLISTLKALGYKSAILSGGFTYFGQHFQRRLGIDYVFANELEVQAGALTGNVVGPIVNAQRKAELLQELTTKENIRLEQTIAVGDGANDLPMLALAGLGVAFRAKPKVRAAAKQQISASGLDGVLYLLGLKERDVQRLNPR